MSIYIDAVWFLNFLIDLMLLYLTAIILKLKVSKKRIVLGAVIGSLIVFAAFTPWSSILLHPFVKFVYSILIVYTSFGFVRLKKFVQSIFTFYFVTFLVGGGLIGLHYYFYSDATIVNSSLTTFTTGFGDPISWLFVIVGFPFVWLFSKRRIEHFEVRKLNFQHRVDVEIKIESTTLQVKGLIDSGNQLHDPITQTPVMILDVSNVSEQLPDSLVQLCTDAENLSLSTEESEWSNRMRIIPYRAVGHDHQFLFAVKPDNVSIHYENHWISVTKTLVGLTLTKLSPDNEYECIIHPKMILSAKQLA